MFAVIAKRAVMVAEAVALWVIKAAVLVVVVMVAMVMVVVFGLACKAVVKGGQDAEARSRGG